MYEMQLKEFGMQLQNIGSQIINIGVQLQKMMNSFGIPLQNIGQQISNISSQIFNLGIQISNVVMPFFNNPFQNQNFLNNYINQNNNIINIKNLDNKIMLNIDFNTWKGKIRIISNGDQLIEEIITEFLKRFKYMGKEEDLFFLYNGKRISRHEKRTIVGFGLMDCSSIDVVERI